MDDSFVDSTGAAQVLGITTRNAALRIMAAAGVPTRRGKYGEVFALRSDVEALAARRKELGMTNRPGWVPGRPRKKTATSTVSA